MRPDEIVWDLRMIECHPIQKGEGEGWVAVPPVALKNAIETVIGPGNIRYQVCDPI